MKEKDRTQAAYVANQSKSYNKAKQSCELNHNHEAISIQAQIEGVWYFIHAKHNYEDWVKVLTTIGIWCWQLVELNSRYVSDIFIDLVWWTQSRWS